MEYITKNDTIIFAPQFNKKLDNNLICIYKKIIFSNYKLNEDLFDVYLNDNFYDLKHIKSQFNQIVNELPNSITHLTFGHKFNQVVNNLPNSLTHLTFGIYFNQVVDNLPNSLTHLSFGPCFNQKVDNLPNSLTHLTFGELFDQKIYNLPNSLTHLNFGELFDQKIYNLPNSLTNIKCWKYYSYLKDFEKYKVKIY